MLPLMESFELWKNKNDRAAPSSILGIDIIPLTKSVVWTIFGSATQNTANGFMSAKATVPVNAAVELMVVIEPTPVSGLANGKKGPNEIVGLVRAKELIPVIRLL